MPNSWAYGSRLKSSQLIYISLDRLISTPTSMVVPVRILAGKGNYQKDLKEEKCHVEIIYHLWEEVTSSEMNMRPIEL